MTSSQTETNPLKNLAEFGQSPWLDFISRELMTSGKLQEYIDRDGLKGVTSNPAIFEKAIGAGVDYADFIKESLGSAKEKLKALGLYELIAIRDIQAAADVLKSVYDATNGRDGYVSLEVAPSLSDDAEGTLAEARRLWQIVNRPNLMVKVPATKAGITAFEQLIADGINVNVTLLFAQDAYRQIAEAYIRGLEKREGDLSKVASVASFFVSRIDSLIDKQIEEKIAATSDEAEKQTLQNLLGKVAVANAKMAYQTYLKTFSGESWEKLVARGAQTQRVLWASTGTKNEKYSDVLYVEELIGAETVNTIPPKTWDAFRDHGKLRESLTENVEEARETLANLEKAGISLETATDQLLIEAVKLFVEPFDKMIAAVEKAMA